MRIKEEDMKERREMAISSAFELFCERGIESVKMSQIAKKSGISEATIYRYFGNKEMLVLESFIKSWDVIMGNVDKIVVETPHYALLSGYEQMQIWIEGFRYLYQDSEEFVLFSYEAKLYLLRHGIKLDKFQQEALMRTFRGSCIAALDKGKEDGSIPVKENSEDLFYAIWGTIRGYVVKIVIYSKLYKENNPWESRYRVMKNGILSALRTGWSVPEHEMP